jgi:nitroreductase
MDVTEAIRFKRAVRQYAVRELPDAVVRHILNAGRRAQSSKNSQPWHFIAIRKRETLRALSKMGTYADHLGAAALGIAILTPDPAQRWSIMFDAGQAAAYMQLAAWEKGIASCIATIYQPEEARRLLSFPEHLHLNVALSFGYPADDAVLVARPLAGGRRPYEDVVHWEHW